MRYTLFFGMKRRFAQYVTGAICATALAAIAARADTVALRGKLPFKNVEVRDFVDGKLEFRGVSRETLRKPLVEIARIEIATQPMLTNAELLRGRNPAAASTAYELARADCTDAWIKDLACARLVGTYNDAGRFAPAVRAYLDVTRRHPQLANSLLPRNAAAPGSDDNRLAIKELRSFWNEAAPAGRPEGVRRLFLELLIIEDAQPVPPDLQPPAAADRPKPAESQPKPEDENGLPPLLFGDEPPEPPALHPHNDDAAAPPPTLSGNSIALAAARQLLAADQFAAAGAILERLQPYLDTETELTARILLARCRIETGRPAVAADDMLRLAESTTDRTLAATAFYHVALAHERLDRADVALDIYSKLLDREDLSVELREQVRQRLSGLER